MKRDKAFCFLMSLVSILGSPRVSYGGSKTGSVSGVVADSNLSNKSVKNETPETKKTEDKNNIKKKTMLKVILNKIKLI